MLEDRWQQCLICSRLVASENGICYGTNHHLTKLQQRLALRRDEPSAPGQHGWRHCTRCTALVFGTDGVCPATHGKHTPDASDYAVVHAPGADPGLGDAVVGVQGWRWCSKCHALYRLSGPCPAGQQHSLEGSGHYAIPTSAQALWIRTPVRRVVLSRFSIGFDFDWAPDAGRHGVALSPGQGAWAVRTNAAGTAHLTCAWERSTSGEGSSDLTMRRTLLHLMHQHLFTPGLLLKIHAFPGSDPAWDDSSPEIELHRLP